MVKDIDIPDEGGGKKNYLTRLAGENRRFVRRECNLCLGFLTTQKGVRGVTVGKIWLHNISEGGALASTSRWKVPDHFYLYLGEFQYLIGCSVVARQGDVMRVQFIKEQDSELIDIFSRITDPFEFRDRINPALYGLPNTPKQKSMVG